MHVATAVFRDLPDRVLAGRVAGRAFTGGYGIALVAALFALIVVHAKTTRMAAQDRILAIAFTGVAALQSFWVAPAIVRHGAGWPGSFASLHAAGGAFHLALAVLALFLAWRLLDEADGKRNREGAEPTGAVPASESPLDDAAVSPLQPT